MLCNRSERSQRVLLTVVLTDKMMMASPKSMTCFFIYLLIFPSIFDKSNSELDSDSTLAANRTEVSEGVKRMFSKAYENYIMYAWPHDELKPLTRSFTDSFSGFGNSKNEHQPGQYNGSAITFIESLSSLFVMGYYHEFKNSVSWLSSNLRFDIDARINLYEWNTRVLGGLVSAHILAADLLQGTYHYELLKLAEDLGRRFLPAFDTPTGLPYAWINLKYGVMKNETTMTSPAECGSLILEMGTLSRLTHNTQFESAALHALRKLWSMRSSMDLLGTKLNVVTGEWMEYSSGIGAGLDTFYESLIKAHILFGRDEFWTMFHSAYIAVQRYMRYGQWYKTVDMRTGEDIHCNPTSVQALWPSIQVLIGDIASANLTHREFFSVWLEYGLPPERFIIENFPSPKLTVRELFAFLRKYWLFPDGSLMKLDMLHPTERQYPLRPEFVESTFYLYQATKDPWYLDVVGKVIIAQLNRFTKVYCGYSSIKDVINMLFEDHQPGYFLSETLKYLYLLYNDSFLDNDNYIFTTKGHPLPVMSPRDRKKQQIIEYTYSRSGPTEDNDMALLLQKLAKDKKPSALLTQVCPSTTTTTSTTEGDHNMPRIESACHVLDARPDHRCSTHEDCGVDLFSCIPRECSSSGYCGDRYFSRHFQAMRTVRATPGKITQKNKSSEDTLDYEGPLIIFQ